MLSVHVSSGHIARCQDHYLDQGWRGAEIADDIRIMARKLDSQARSFSKRQQRGSASTLPDGRVETLTEALFTEPMDHAWPWGSAHFLGGLQLGKARPLPPSLQVAGQQYPGTDCYCAPMTFGPEIARAFGQLIALVVYLQPTRSMWIVWIGLEKDLAHGLADVEDQSSGFARWPDMSD